MNKLGNDLRSYKDQCFKIIKKDELDSADQALMFEPEKIIIKKSIKYVQLEDETLLQQGSASHVKEINKAITSIELPMEDLPIAKVKQIFDKIVIVDEENYMFVINTANKPLEKESLKKVAEINPLLESRCKAKNKGVEFVNWRMILIS